MLRCCTRPCTAAHPCQDGQYGCHKNEDCDNGVCVHGHGVEMYGGKCLDSIRTEFKSYTVPAGDILNYNHVKVYNQGNVLANYYTQIV